MTWHALNVWISFLLITVSTQEKKSLKIQSPLSSSIWTSRKKMTMEDVILDLTERIKSYYARASNYYLASSPDLSKSINRRLVTEHILQILVEEDPDHFVSDSEDEESP